MVGDSDFRREFRPTERGATEAKLPLIIRLPTLRILPPAVARRGADIQDTAGSVHGLGCLLIILAIGRRGKQTVD